MKEQTLINSEKLPVVEDLDMMEYCLEIKKETRGLNCPPSNCLTNDHPFIHPQLPSNWLTIHLTSDNKVLA